MEPLLRGHHDERPPLLKGHFSDAKAVVPLYIYTLGFYKIIQRGDTAAINPTTAWFCWSGMTSTSTP